MSLFSHLTSWGGRGRTLCNEINRTNTWRGFYSLSDVTVGTSHLFHAMRILVRLSLKKGRSFNSIRSLRNKSKSDAHFSKLPAFGIGDSNSEFWHHIHPSGCLTSTCPPAVARAKKGTVSPIYRMRRRRRVSNRGIRSQATCSQPLNQCSCWFTEKIKN